MKQIFFLLIFFSSLFNLLGQDVNHHNIDSLYHNLNCLLENEVKAELIVEKVNFLLTLDTCNADLFNLKGRCYHELEDFEAAKYFYFLALTVDTLHFDALYNLGVIFYNEGIKEVDGCIEPITKREFLERNIRADNKFRFLF